MTRIQHLEQNLKPFKTPLTHHPLYTAIQSVEDLRIFMEHHVFAVWDFMSLLKSLQVKLTCVTTPWTPVGKGRVRYLINEIVTGEESDVNEHGERSSHFEMYLSAMHQIGASAEAIESLLAQINNEEPLFDCLNRIEPDSIANFTNFTFRLIEEGKPHKIAAAFTFGREDLIPEMFIGLLEDLKKKEQINASELRYYLQRHIEIDGDEHGHLSLEMVELLCGEDDQKWAEAQEAAARALELRNELWNGVVHALSNRVVLA